MMLIDEDLWKDDPPACTQCGKPPTLTDALGIMWCDDCQHRYDFITWGSTHGYPALMVEPYAVAEGAYFWQIAAAIGSDDMIWLLSGMIQMIDKGVA